MSRCVAPKTFRPDLGMCVCPVRTVPKGETCIPCNAPKIYTVVNPHSPIISYASCVCPSNMTVSGDTCAPCPAPKTVIGGKCVCPSNMIVSGDTCALCSAPKIAARGKCVCPPDTKLSIDKCIPNKCEAMWNGTKFIDMFVVENGRNGYKCEQLGSGYVCKKEGCIDLQCRGGLCTDDGDGDWI